MNTVLQHPAAEHAHATTRRRRVVNLADMLRLDQVAVLVFEDAQLAAARVLDGGPLLLGRGPDCDLRLRDPEVSRRHCMLVQEGGAVRLRDLGSVNGTFVAGARVRETLLQPGDVVLLGQVLLKLVVVGSPEWRVHSQLFEQLYSDELTGLLNRRGFRLRSDGLLAALPTGAGVGLLMLDIDRFKRVNDLHGHETGDRAIAGVGRCLAAALPAGALAARLGGEEFCVLVETASTHELAVLGERLRAVVQALRIDAGGAALALTVSVGGACQLAPLPGLRGLFVAADRRLYEAKHAGRNRCRVGGAVLS
jgi:two-component system, cell cycle response regulator